MSAYVKPGEEAVAEPPADQTASVQVRQAILHTAGTKLRLSGRPVVLAEIPTFAEYLTGHIANSLHDSQTRAAKVINTEPQGAVAICESLLLGRYDLVDASRRLATLLHTAIGGDRRITPGVFVVALCAEAQHGTNDLVAMLKLDPGSVFQQEWRTDAAGHVYLSVHLLADALPTVRERLQKAAFVRAVQPDDHRRLLVLDRQVSGVSANFFLEDFLGAQAQFDEAQLTHELYSALRVARQDLAKRDVVPPDRLTTLDDFIRGVFAQQGIDLSQVLPQMRREEREAVEREVDARQLDRAFAFDPKTLAKLTRKRRYRGDYGLRVEIDADHFDDVIHVGDPDRAGQRLITIKTSTWDPQ
jgi:hypothetical protein